MKIYIQYCLGTAQTYQFDVDRCTTIKQLKEKLLQKLNTNNNADMDTLYFLQKDTEFFDETATLEDYEIEDETILQAVKPNSRSSFGGSGRRFADLSNDQGLKKIAWAKTAPEWRIAPHGLCLEGICNNETCKAFKQTVIIPIGYKRFDILVDSNSKTITVLYVKNMLIQKAVVSIIVGGNLKVKNKTNQVTNQNHVPVIGEWLMMPIIVLIKKKVV